jgi:predicted ATPase
MLSFVELREKVAKIGSGEKEVKKYKGGKRKKTDIQITQKGRKFAVYVDGEKLDDNFKNAKEAEKSANDFIKLMGEESE